MVVRAVYLNRAHAVRAVRYAWAEERNLLSHPRSLSALCGSGSSLFAQLRAHLETLCIWQKRCAVFLGFQDSLVELLTIYHEFELSPGSNQTLMLVCTPPDEYFEAVA